MTLFKPSWNCQGKRKLIAVRPSAMTRKLIVGKSSYAINKSRNTVSLELYVRLTKVEAFGSLLRHAQRRALLLCDYK